MAGNLRKMAEIAAVEASFPSLRPTMHLTSAKMSLMLSAPQAPNTSASSDLATARAHGGQPTPVAGSSTGVTVLATQLVFSKSTSTSPTEQARYIPSYLRWSTLTNSLIQEQVRLI